MPQTARTDFNELARLARLEDYLRLRAQRPENRTAADRQAARGLKAVALSPTFDICRALLRGEKVPVELLDQDAVGRYEVRL